MNFLLDLVDFQFNLDHFQSFLEPFLERRLLEDFEDFLEPFLERRFPHFFALQGVAAHGELPPILGVFPYGLRVGVHQVNIRLVPFCVRVGPCC